MEQMSLDEAKERAQDYIAILFGCVGNLRKAYEASKGLGNESVEKGNLQNYIIAINRTIAAMNMYKETFNRRDYEEAVQALHNRLNKLG